MVLSYLIKYSSVYSTNFNIFISPLCDYNNLYVECLRFYNLFENKIIYTSPGWHCVILQNYFIKFYVYSLGELYISIAHKNKYNKFDNFMKFILPKQDQLLSEDNKYFVLSKII